MKPGALALVGPGRAGSTLTTALVARGWTVRSIAGRSRRSVAAAARHFEATAVSVSDVGRGADLVIVATPDAAIADVARRIADRLEPGALVVHLSGASDLGVLDPIATTRPDVRVGSMHPLQTMPQTSVPGSHAPVAGLDDPLEGAWCAVEGPAVDLAMSLGMHPVVVPPEQRAAYHAAATVASNHLVALAGQVERIAAQAGVPFEAFLPLVDATVDGIRRLGPRDALTGPVARGDVDTVAAHLDVIDDAERDAYRSLAAAALALTGRDDDAMNRLLHDANQRADAPTDAAQRLHEEVRT